MIRSDWQQVNQNRYGNSTQHLISSKPKPTQIGWFLGLSTPNKSILQGNSTVQKKFKFSLRWKSWTIPPSPSTHSPPPDPNRKIKICETSHPNPELIFPPVLISLGWKEPPGDRKKKHPTKKQRIKMLMGNHRNDRKGLLWTHSCMGKYVSHYHTSTLNYPIWSLTNHKVSI
jgi:hypothetical protein